MPNKWSAGCGCCVSCILATDNFDRADNDSLGGDWTEASGDSDIVSNRLQSIGAAIAVHNTASAEANWQVRADVVFSSTAGQVARLIIGYSDTNNYHYCEIANNNGFSAGYVKLYSVVSGSHTELDSYTVSTTTGTFECYVCYHGTTGTLVGGIEGQNASVAVASLAGTKGGLATPAGQTRDFDNFEIVKFDGNCEDCDVANTPQPCGNCTEQVPPWQIQGRLIETNPGGDPIQGDTCTTAECDEVVNGTWTDLIRVPKERLNQLSAYGIAGQCGWEGSRTGNSCNFPQRIEVLLYKPSEPSGNVFVLAFAGGNWTGTRDTGSASYPSCTNFFDTFTDLDTGNGVDGITGCVFSANDSLALQLRLKP